MDEMTRLQLLTEAVLEFRTHINSDLKVESIGKMVIDIVQNANDPQLLELVQTAYKQRENRQVAYDILNEAMSYMYEKIDRLQNSSLDL